MNIDDGKKFYTTFSEAEQVASKMSHTHNEGFRPYKVGEKWAVGGIHTRPVHKKEKVNAFEDIWILLQEFKESEEDSSVDDYIAEIESDSLSKESSIQGSAEDWILNAIELKLGRDIGMSINNDKTYLVLSLSKGTQQLTLKMGGNFGPYIPLIRRQAESLVNEAVIWHTWNSNTSSWKKDAWFYRIQKK